MLNKQEIEKYAKDITDIAGWDREVYISGFIDGSTFVNELQPHTAEDMKEFFLWLRPKLVEDDGINFLLWNCEKTKTFDELLKLWENDKSTK
jgi:hypothetical protein